jgi:hypothetical protein
MLRARQALGRIVHSTFRLAILNVVSLSSQEQVSRVAAAFDIARVKDIAARCINSECFQSCTVSSHWTTPNAQPTVASVIYGASPQPALIGTLYSTPVWLHRGIVQRS